jgi:hypothetical protein
MTKISQLSELSTITSDDIFVIVNDPAGVASTKKVTAQRLLEFVDSELGVDIVPVSGGGTGATNASDARTNLGLGSLARQSMDNVTITGGSVSIDGIFNTGLSLSSNSFSTAKVSARSPVTDFKSVAEVPIFTVPNDHMFLIDSMEIVTISIENAGVPPKVRFGVTDDESLFYPPTRMTSNAFGERHVIETPQHGIESGSVVSFGVTEASTAISHSGVAVVTGYLLKTI